MESLEEKLVEIYEETYKDVFRYIVSKCENISDVQDLIQNTYLNFYKAMKKKEIKEPKKYIITIARNEIYKTYGIVALAKNHIPIFSLGNDIQEYMIDDALKVTENYEVNIICDEIWSFLERGDPLTFKIFIFYFKEDMKIKEIAKVLSVGESTVKNRLYRKIKELKEKFNI